MIIRRLNSFKDDFRKLPGEIQRRAEKQLRFLAQNPNHPSLRTKKMVDSRNIWEGRITKNYRFTFQIESNTFILRRIGTHDVLKKP